MNTNSPIDAMLDELTDNPAEIKADLERLRAESALVEALMARRREAGLSQRELAKRSGLAPAKVCRMESGDDASLKIGDVKQYLGGINCSMHILLDDESLPAAAKIKQSVISIGRELAKLAALAEQDPTDKLMIDGINRFRGEVLFNFLVRYAGTQSPIAIGQEPPASVPSPTPEESPALLPV